MKLTRRRFLTISAAMAASPVWAGTHSWQGRALGADVSLTIRGERTASAEALSQARAMLAEIERLFSLYDPTSDLVTLNRQGVRRDPDPRFVTLMQTANQGHELTGGLFDPTVQPLWLTLAQGGDVDTARHAVGWDRVRFDPTEIRLGQGQALTFNGIAQGFATDLIAGMLGNLGMTDMLVNIGEYHATGGPWQLGISDPVHGYLGTRTLTQGALATSSPTAMSLGDHTHILHPTAIAQWSTVSVEAETAALADCLSTALCLAPMDQIVEVRQSKGVKSITLVDFEGNLSRI